MLYEKIAVNIEMVFDSFFVWVLYFFLMMSVVQVMLHLG